MTICDPDKSTTQKGLWHKNPADLELSWVALSHRQGIKNRPTCWRWPRMPHLIATFVTEIRQGPAFCPYGLTPDYLAVKSRIQEKLLASAPVIENFHGCRAISCLWQETGWVHRTLYFATSLSYLPSMFWCSCRSISWTSSCGRVKRDYAVKQSVVNETVLPRNFRSVSQWRESSDCTRSLIMEESMDYLRT